MFPNLGSQYKFIKEIGSGGTGVVNLAIDNHSGYQVAIKTLFDFHKEDAEILNKFKIEANIYLLLEHPNIVSLKNFIIQDGSPHLVQEYIEGNTLEEYINTVTGPIPTEIALAIFKEILSGINYAHKKHIPFEGYEEGVLHLDVKPSNILVSKGGDIKIIDYGISQGKNEERGEKIMGSLMYMAPEQLDINKQLDTRTDIYSLGVLFHEMITGSKPYPLDISKDDLFRNIISNPLVRTNEIYPGADDRLQEIVDKATQKDPKNRYQSCVEMIEKVESLLVLT